ncbi:MAG: type I restriction endonuclease subunit R, partial [Candidatus Saccharicenans sp.]
KDLRNEFYKFFREIEEIYEILSPDVFLRPHMKDYDQLVQVYRLVRSAYEPGVPVDKSFLRKTSEIVQRHTHTTGIESPFETYEIGIKALEAIAGKEGSDTVKVFNLLKNLHALIEERGQENPYLISIGERADQIRQMYEEHKASAAEALKELLELIKKLKEAEEEMNTTGLSKIAFAAKWWFESQDIEADKAEKIASELDKAFTNYPHWASTEQQGRALRQKLYKAMIEGGIKAEEVVGWGERLLGLLKKVV